MLHHVRRNSVNKKLRDSKSGFTIVEVMLVLAISGMLLIGIIGGTFNSIAAQRYNDSLRSFAEYLRGMYSEVINPQSLGSSDPDKLIIGNSKDYAILGKVLVFGYDYGNVEDNNSVFSATLVGNAIIPDTTAIGFLQELSSTGPDGLNASLFCGDSRRSSTVSQYVPLWETEFRQANNDTLHTSYNNQFKGTIIIARSPSSGAVHTVYAKDLTYDLKNSCQPNAGGLGTLENRFKDDLKNIPTTGNYNISDPIEICLKPTTTAVRREIRINADGRNTSAVNTLTDEDSQCQ